MHKFKTATLTVSAILLIMVVLQNTQSATFQLLLWEVSMSRAIFYSILLGIGFLMGLLYCYIKRN
ncbi:MAG: putative integral membrane protein [Candidatus Omnitrophota bacterium]|jgi:uncharacterized integral membrane protein